MNIPENLLKEKSIQSVLDIRCGDWSGVTYIGMDVVNRNLKNGRILTLF